jgi:hypothetical protein
MHALLLSQASIGKTTGLFHRPCASTLSPTASGDLASVSGGERNLASGITASISGGFHNTASGLLASISGGLNRTASGVDDWVAGSLFENF